MQNNNKYELHENILINLKMKAKHTGKSLDEVVAEYKKLIEEEKKQAEEENKKNEKFKEILKDIAKLSGQDINEVIKEAFEKAGLKMPNYQSIKALYDYKNIKENDTLIFDMDYTELEDGKIYLFEFEIWNRDILLYAEYNKKIDSFILSEEEKKILKRDDEDIKILGILIKTEKKYWFIARCNNGYNNKNS